MQFEVCSWDGKESGETSLANAPDSEKWIMFVKEFNASIENDDFKNGNHVIIKQLDGNKQNIPVPVNWTYGKLKSWLSINSKVYLPWEIRLVLAGAPVNDADLVLIDVKRNNPIILHFIVEL